MHTPADRPETWAQRQARLAAERRQPEALQELARQVRAVVEAGGVDVTGITTADPFPQVREAIEARKAAGQHAGMSFTFVKPERSTTPALLLPNAAALVVGARSYQRQAPGHPDGAAVDGPAGRIARYQWMDHYAVLERALGAGAELLKAAGWRARVVVDDNALVDRAAAHRAGLGWWGKNANLLLPGRGSWFVLGSLVTDAPLPPSTDEPVADGCGTCAACLPACPTGAIVAPGVLDARRCLAWLVQAPGDFPVEHRVALGDRIYGCDDCQTVCPVNRIADRHQAPPTAEEDAVDVVDLVWLARARADQILGRFGRWYLPDRDPNALRRNALLALGNVGSADDQRVVEAIGAGLRNPSAMIRRHAAWSAGRLGLLTLLDSAMGTETDATVVAAIEAALRDGRSGPIDRSAT